MEDIVNEEDYGNEDDSDENSGMRIDPEVLEELQYMTRNIKEEQLEETFKKRLDQLFADVNSLNNRFPPELSHHEGIIGSIENTLKE